MTELPSWRGLPFTALRPVDFADLCGVSQNAFGEKEAGRQFEVVAGSPHGDGDGFVAEADFEGFFDGQQILKGRGRFAFDLPDRYREDRPVHTDFMVTRVAGGRC